MTKGGIDQATVGKGPGAFASLAALVEAYAPDCIVQFSPDHFNGFFYDLMPQFCVGAGAQSIGDWGGSTGPLPVDEAFALQLLDAMTRSTPPTSMLPSPIA